MLICRVEVFYFKIIVVEFIFEFKIDYIFYYLFFFLLWYYVRDVKSNGLRDFGLNIRSSLGLK